MRASPRTRTLADSTVRQEGQEGLSGGRGRCQGEGGEVVLNYRSLP